MLQVIKFGFQEIKIKDDYAYHPQFWSKGRLLYESNCVHAVQELKYRENSKHEWSVSIKGIVERQTSKSLPPYDVTLNVDNKRYLKGAECTCAYGESGICKHVSAVILQINNDSSKSKTSTAQEWGIPNVAKAVQEKYSKGKEVDELVAERRKVQSRKRKVDINGNVENTNKENSGVKISNKCAILKERNVNLGTDDNNSESRSAISQEKNVNTENFENKVQPVERKHLKPKERKEKVKRKSANIISPVELKLELFKNISCPLATTLEVEMKTEEERLQELQSRTRKELESKLAEEKRLDYILGLIFSNSNSFTVFTQGYQSKDIFNSIIYYEQIVVNLEAIKKICKDTVDQSNCSTWFKIRDLRISATKAHKIKRRRKDVDDTFLENLMSRIELKGKGLENVTYGKDNEKVALQEFKLKYGLDVYEVGVIISLLQPWLCASPDGIVKSKYGYQVLEIKCPSSCKEKPIVEANKRLNVPYLEWRDGRLQLIKSNEYYTQCQILMYVLGCDFVYFYVYSPIKSAITLVGRDEAFLRKNIIKLEKFYFEHYLPKLCDKKFK